MDKIPNRVVLIGLDGATFSILNPLIQDGTMPFLSAFLSQGVRGVLYSTPHPLTPPAWTTVMTGRSPGNHGIFDFVRVEYQYGRPTYTLVTSADIQCETIWSIASRQRCRITSLNFPCMFPPPQVDGFIVPGYVPWSYLRRAVHPRDLYARLKTQPNFNARELGTDWDLERKAIQGLAKEELSSWVRFHITREQQWFEIVRFLMLEEPCDLTAVIFDGVDRLQHLCFHLLDPETAWQFPSALEQHVRSLCLDYFKQLDDFLADIAEMAGPDAHIYIVSDHGFTAVGDEIFYANVWLQQHGYLKWADGIPLDQKSRLGLDNHDETSSLFDWSGTTAFALTSSGNAIFIRQAEEPGDPGIPAYAYPAFRERLIQELLAFKNPKTNKPVIKRILTREEAFPGSQMRHAPDLTLVLQDYSFLSVLRAETPLKRRLEPYGIHHPDGVFMGRGPGIRRGEEVAPFSILNVAPTLLYSLGLPVPGDLEGEAVASIFESSFLTAHPIDIGAPTLPLQALGGDEEMLGLQTDEEAQVLERLKALGYLE